MNAAPPAPVSAPAIQPMSNSGATRKGMSPFAIFGIVLAVISLIVLIVWVVSSGKGKKCTPKDSQKVDNANTYVFNSFDGNCVVSNCLDGYNLSDNLCSPNADCSFTWPDSFTPDTATKGCSQTATITQSSSGNGALCPSILTRTFGSTDSNCVPLFTPAQIGEPISIPNFTQTPATSNLKYGDYVYSPSGINVIGFTDINSKIVVFVPVSGSDSTDIGNTNNVLAVSVDGLSILLPSTGTGTGTSLTTFNKGTDAYKKGASYLDAKYDKYKFNLTTDGPPVKTLTMTPAVSTATATTPYSMNSVQILDKAISFYNPTLPLQPTGFNLSNPNTLCSITTAATPTTVPSATTIELCTAACPSNSCKAFQFGNGVCNTYTTTTTSKSAVDLADFGNMCYLATQTS